MPCEIEIPLEYEIFKIFRFDSQNFRPSEAMWFIHAHNNRIDWRQYTDAVCTREFMCSRRNPNKFQELCINDKSNLDASNFVRANPTIIFSHGFAQNGQTNSILKLRDSKFF